MDNKVEIILLTVLLLVVSRYTNAADKVDLVSPENGVFDEDDKINLTCANPGWNSQARILGQWRKKVVRGFLNGSNDGSAEMVLTANNVVTKDEFKNQDNYKATAQLQVGTLYFSFEIEEAKPWDSGLYTCMILSDSLPSQSINIVVVSEIDSVVWYVMKNGEKMMIQKDGLLRMKEEEEVYLICEVKGAYPEAKIEVFTSETPDMHSTIENDTPHKPTHITHLFNHTSTQNPTSLIFDSALTASPLIVTFHHHKKEMVCAGVVKDKDAVTASFNIVLEEYKPFFKCPPIVKVKLGTNNFTFNCMVHAQPVVQDCAVITANEEDKNISFSVSMNPVEGQDELLDVVVSIERVTKEHLVKYQFYADNFMGKSQQYVELEEDLSPMKASKTSSSSLLHSSPLSIFLTISSLLITISPLLTIFSSVLS